MPRKPYSINELEIRLSPHNPNDHEEIARVSSVLNNLLCAVQKNQHLTLYEQNFFCSAVGKTIELGRKTTDFEVCKLYHFTNTYLSYSHCIYGGIPYFKPDPSSLNVQEATMGWKEVPLEEVRQDLSYLHAEAESWQNLTLEKRHSTELLQFAIKETKDQLKKLSKEIPANEVGTHRSRYKRLAVLLLQKYMYTLCAEVNEYYNNRSALLTLNGFTIEFTISRLYHICSGHYAQGVRQLQGQSYIVKDFDPRTLFDKLREVISLIDFSGYYSKDLIENITIRYNGILYRIYNKRTKPSYTKAEYLVKTFYPLYDEAKIATLYSEYEEKQINQELAVYCRK